MKADRMFTVACAKRDFSKDTSAEVFDAFKNDDLVAAFRDRPLDSELSQRHQMHRGAAWREEGQPGSAPGSAAIHKLTTEGWRAYLWRDDGSAYHGDIGGEVVWLFGKGQRYADSDHLDFHKNLGLKLMLDPTDSWKPAKQDYTALFQLRAEAELEAGRQAVRDARDQALEHPNKVIPVELPRLDASLGEVHWDHPVEGVIMDDHHFRYFVLARVYSGTHEQVGEELALDYAEEAFEGLELWSSVGAVEIMLEGLDHLKDEDYYCYAAELGAQP